jgi:hypothetical protein
MRDFLIKSHVHHEYDIIISIIAINTICNYYWNINYIKIYDDINDDILLRYILQIHG